MNNNVATFILMVVAVCAAESTAFAQPGKIEEGPSPPQAALAKTYAERIKARILPNLVFVEEATAQTFSELEVRCTPDGKIVSAKVIRSSGLEAWDKATLRAVERSEVLPRDSNGEMPAVFTLVFRPY